FAKLVCGEHPPAKTALCLWHQSLAELIWKFERSTLIRIFQKGMRYISLVRRHFAVEAMLLAFDRLPQHPPYRDYWYDPTIHALVGLNVALDFHRHDGRYHVIETNLGPELRPQRRALYDTPLDPIISALVAVARPRGFERLVFFQTREWSKPYLDEFQF